MLRPTAGVLAGAGRPDQPPSAARRGSATPRSAAYRTSGSSITRLRPRSRRAPGCPVPIPVLPTSPSAPPRRGAAPAIPSAASCLGSTPCRHRSRTSQARRLARLSSRSTIKTQEPTSRPLEPRRASGRITSRPARTANSSLAGKGPPLRDCGRDQSRIAVSAGGIDTAKTENPPPLGRRCRGSASRPDAAPTRGVAVDRYAANPNVANGWGRTSQAMADLGRAQAAARRAHGPAAGPASRAAASAASMTRVTAITRQ